MSALAPARRRAIVAELTARFGGTFTEAEVAFVVEDSWASLDPGDHASPYLHLLVRRAAQDRLTDMLHYREALTTPCEPTGGFSNNLPRPRPARR